MGTTFVGTGRGGQQATLPRRGAELHRPQLHPGHRGGADDPRPGELGAGQCDRGAARGERRRRRRERHQARAPRVGARDRHQAVPGRPRGRRGAARAAPPGRRGRRQARPHDRLRRHAPVRAVGGPAHLRPPALPRPDRGAALRRAPGGHLRPARPRRDRRRRQGHPRRQRDARARRAAARAVGQLAVLARRRHRPGLRPDADLPPVPARRDAARLRGLGRLRAPHRLHGRLEGDGGLHLPLVRRPPAPELRDGRDPRDGRADAGRAHARRSRR